MAGDSADLLAITLVDAQVDLNPHQVDAAFFALSKGVVLAAEIGLDTTEPVLHDLFGEGRV